MKKINNKGFTLIEVLAVIVILVIIMSIAIPSITSMIDRQSCNLSSSKTKIFENMAQIYVGDHRNSIEESLESNNSCFISLSKMKEADLLTDKDLLDDNNETIDGYVIYTKPTTISSEKYEFCIRSSTSCSNIPKCADNIKECIN